jgi:hypothetical protein
MESLVIDSKKKLITGPEILAQYVYHNDTAADPNIPKNDVLTALAAEASLPNTDIIQVGNTVYMGHYGEGEDSKKMVGRAFNIDTARNFAINGFKYFTYLQERGFTHYTTSFSTPVYLNAFKLFQRRIERDEGDTVISVSQSEDDPNTFVVYMLIGKQPLSEGLLR